MLLLLMRLLGRDYFVVLAISPEGNLGRAVLNCEKQNFKWPVSLLCNDLPET